MRQPQGDPEDGSICCLMPGRGKGKSQDHWEFPWDYTMFAWLLFSLTLFCFAVIYHNNEVGVWSILVVCGFFSVLAISQSWEQYNENKSNEIARRRYLVACWMVGSVVFAVVLGMFAYDRCIKLFWQTRELEARLNVLPSEPAGAYVNVGEIVFADEARIDGGKTIGYKDGDVYCVAPIAGDHPLDKVQFWAAGVDCCGSRSNFYCDDAWDKDARSGIVLQEKSYLRLDRRPFFMKAVKMAEVTYAIASAEEPIFVQWIQDPDKVARKFMKQGFWGIFVVIVIAPFFCALYGCFFAYSVTPNY